ncbi:nanoRNase/pAp phosphatase, hydrolyzes c-di-AMP and oligoRNAs [Halovenus aranensis]|uniref:NanoRNase/pAp phosphatase, hydrolyzes c-di-AMP and oligoRNAs n=1 Tax=Halovenus aranensis TaxID=890420 RepID=A0A1G8X260_9EURY|nr:DHHA1 domain-containing protein [Halovenus aranensis]SDJ84427.1 nanoRNase/pAp phosphatase, hydrolyzes c-di-AMP and oligoRNAs [Halovenus aranensis]
MIDRLVLGSGTLVQRVVGALRDQSGSVRVVTDEESLATTLRNEGTVVEACDPADAEALADLTAEMVVVVEERQTQAVETARAARTAFPDTYLLAYVARDAPTAEDELRTVADRVANPYRQAASHVLDRVGGTGQQLQQLKRVLRSIDRLAVVAHDNPDPDAIASGTALARLAASAGCDPQVCYHGEITHQENRAFVNVLDLDLRQLDPGEGVAAFDGIALVDHARPSVNNQLPDDSDIDIVIDHHPPRAPVDARFVDLRSGVGATSTLLVDYFDLFGTELDTTVATALLFGIHVDTKGFNREVSPADFEAAATVLPAADLGVLERVESPSMTSKTLDIIASAIQSRRVEGKVLMSCVGDLAERDALAQAADRLLQLESITATLVYGVKDGTIYASARSHGVEVDIGETMREAFDPIGSAGGHVDMAGAQISLGILDAVEEQESSLVEIVEDIVEERFLDAIAATTTLRTQPVDDHFEGDRYLVQDDDRAIGSGAFTRDEDR